MVNKPRDAVCRISDIVGKEKRALGEYEDSCVR